MRSSPILRVLILLAVLPAGARASAQTPRLEHEVKAAFLYNFVKFVAWPRDTLPSPDAPLVLCVLGADPFGQVLDDLVQGERVDGRPLAVRRFARAEEAAGCHLLFVSPDEKPRFSAILRAVDARRVLTVSDDLGFLDAGGHLSFFMEEHRVRFAVNADAARAADFQINSRLMQLARIHSRPSGAER